MLLGSQHASRPSTPASQPSLPTLYSGVPSDISERASAAARISLGQREASGACLCQAAVIADSASLRSANEALYCGAGDSASPHRAGTLPTEQQQTLSMSSKSETNQGMGSEEGGLGPTDGSGNLVEGALPITDNILFVIQLPGEQQMSNYTIKPNCLLSDQQCAECILGRSI